MRSPNISGIFASSPRHTEISLDISEQNSLDVSTHVVCMRHQTISCVAGVAAIRDAATVKTMLRLLVPQARRAVSTWSPLATAFNARPSAKFDFSFGRKETVSIYQLLQKPKVMEAYFFLPSLFTRSWKCSRY